MRCIKKPPEMGGFLSSDIQFVDYSKRKVIAWM
jgi:hypothetical protein